MKKQQWVLQSLTYRRQKKLFYNLDISSMKNKFISTKLGTGYLPHLRCLASSVIRKSSFFSGCGSSEPQLLIHCNQIFISFDFFLHCIIHTNARQLSVSLVGGGGAAPAVLSASLGNPHASQKQVSWHGRVNCQELHQPCTGVSTRKGQRQSASPSTWLQLSWRD